MGLMGRGIAQVAAMAGLRTTLCRATLGDAIVDLDYEQRSATVTSKRQSLGDAVIYLHKMPGPHNADVRGNSRLVRGWRIVADATAYLLMFLTVSGIYLWVALKAERRIGFALIAAGTVSFFGLVYVIAA